MTFDKVKYDNQYQKEKYDRIPLNVPKGQKDAIDKHSKEKGYKSITAYIKQLIDQDMSESISEEQLLPSGGYKGSSEQTEEHIIFTAEGKLSIPTPEEMYLLELYRKADTRGKRRIIGSAELEVELDEPVQESTVSKIG